MIKRLAFEGNHAVKWGVVSNRNGDAFLDLHISASLCLRVKLLLMWQLAAGDVQPPMAAAERTAHS
jgi:hypothetical protein